MMAELLRDLILFFMLAFTAIMSFEAGVMSAKKNNYDFKNVEPAFMSGVQK